jgi:hypothetical protein
MACSYSEQSKDAQAAIAAAQSVVSTRSVLQIDEEEHS